MSKDLRIPFLTLLCAVAAIGCRPVRKQASVLAAVGDARFDVNDVSFLYPLPSSQAGVAALIAMPQLSRADYETLVPTAKEALIHPHGGDAPNPIFDQNVFKVVGIRIDPCAKDDPRKAECRSEFRLVLQPVGNGLDVFRPGMSTFDAALHMIYVVPPDQKDALVSGLRQLLAKAAGRTSGKPLGVHPILATEGVGGPYDQELRRLVATFATPDRLQIATHVNVFESDRWFFSKTERKGSRLVRAEIPFTNSDMQEFKTDGATHEARIVKSPSVGPDNVNILLDSDVPTGRFFAQSEAQKQAQIQAAIRIDNPLIHTPATLDCVSCHTATRALNRAGRNLGDTGGTFADRYIVPAGITGTRVLDQDENIWSVRSFGYFFAKAAITKGTINDSAKVAAELNGISGGGQPSPNPSPSPSPSRSPTPFPTITPLPTTAPFPTTTPFPSGGLCKPGEWQIENQCIKCQADERIDVPTRRCVRNGSTLPTFSCKPGEWQIENQCLRCQANERLDVATRSCVRQ